MAVNETQLAFDKQYISSSEIMKDLKVTRTALFTARMTGKLPDAINIQGKIFLWERCKVQPYLEAWKMVLNVRRGAK